MSPGEFSGEWLEEKAHEVEEWQKDGAFDPGVEIAILAFGLVGRIKTFFQARTLELGLTVQEGELFMQLAGCEPMTMRVLADKARIDPSNLTNIVARMEARGLVRREPSPEDRRTKTVVITEAGSALGDRLLERLSEGNPAVDGLDEDEIHALRGMLRRLVTEPVARPLHS